MNYLLTISNLLTFSRIVLTPFVVHSLMQQAWLNAFIIFSIAAFTDVLDGYYARVMGQASMLGALFDPIADKILLLASFATLAFVHFPSLSIPAWFVVIMVAREVVLVAGIVALIGRGYQVAIKPSIWGKLTTFFQILLFCWLFVCYFFSWTPYKTYTIFLYLLTLFSVFSLSEYIKVGFSYLKAR